MSGQRSPEHLELIRRLRALKVFDAVHESEPENPPGKGTYAACWYDGHTVSRELSTMTRAGMVHRYNLRLYRSASRTAQDDIDPDLNAARDKVYIDLVGRNKLADTGFRIDAMGAYSDGLRDEMNWTDFGRRQLFRVMDISIPIYSVTELTYA